MPGTATNPIDLTGYREALAKGREQSNREQLARDAAYLPITETVGPFELRAMTLEDWIVLKNSRSPVLNRLPASAAALERFLWLLAPCYRPGLNLRLWALRKAHSLRCRRVFRSHIVQVQTERACHAYLDETFQDASFSESGSSEASYFSDACYYITLFGRHFNWPPEVTLKMPMKQLFQCVNSIRQHLGQPMGNPSERFVAEWQDKVNRELRAN